MHSMTVAPLEMPDEPKTLPLNPLICDIEKTVMLLVILGDNYRF